MELPDLTLKLLSPHLGHSIQDQYSFRIPAALADRIDRVCALFPLRNRSQVVCELLNYALDGFEEDFDVDLSE